METVSISKLKQVLTNKQLFHQKKESGVFPRNVIGVWGRLVEKGFYFLAKGDVTRNQIIKWIENQDESYELVKQGVNNEHIYNYFTSDLPGFISIFGFNLHGYQPTTFTPVFHEPRWYNLPHLLEIKGRTDGISTIENKVEIIEIKSHLHKKPVWQIEDVIQIVAYAYLYLVERLGRPVNELDIRDQLVNEFLPLPLLKIVYPNAGYISSYFDFQKAEALKMMINQYVYGGEILLNYRNNSNIPLARLFLQNWIVKGDLPPIRW